MKVSETATMQSIECTTIDIPVPATLPFMNLLIQIYCHHLNLQTLCLLGRLIFMCPTTLQQANSCYVQSGTMLIPEPKYKVYVTDKEMEQVAQSPIKKHPCLTEKWSLIGYGG
ncbi:hypothetical protein N1851_012831 [Merluccius polli]|uniref:Uncharacterized protein n=1 Tax=Merluccius polli TaxID=89951 RepID=A0AA47P5S3_MERPO|nr:hypothetical protein N1851_012831 [Merluccius polli]